MITLSEKLTKDDLSGVKRWLNGSVTRVRRFDYQFFVFRYTLVGVIPTFNKGGSPKGLLSKWGIRVQAQSLLMTHPGKCWIKESVGQFLQAPDPGQDKKKKELTDYPTNSLYSLTNPLGSRISREYHNTYVTIRTAWLDFS